MNRRGFLGSLVALAVVPFAPRLSACGPEAAEFPPLNFIDLGAKINGLEHVGGDLYAFTSRGMYRIVGAYPPYRCDGERFRAMHMPLTDSTPMVQLMDRSRVY